MQIIQKHPSAIGFLLWRKGFDIEEGNRVGLGADTAGLERSGFKHNRNCANEKPLTRIVRRLSAGTRKTGKTGRTAWHTLPVAATLAIAPITAIAAIAAITVTSTITAIATVSITAPITAIAPIASITVTAVIPPRLPVEGESWVNWESGINLVSSHRDIDQLSGVNVIWC